MSSAQRMFRIKARELQPGDKLVDEHGIYATVATVEVIEIDDGADQRVEWTCTSDDPGDMPSWQYGSVEVKVIRDTETGGTK